MIPYSTIKDVNLINIQISTYTITLLFAGFAAILLILKQAKKEGIDEKKLLNLIPLLILSAYIGARLFYYFGGFGYSGSILKIFDVGSGGAVFYGGFLAAVLTGFIYTKIKKENFWKYSDLFAAPMMLGLAIGRIGCFLRGCCHGVITKVPWALYDLKTGIARQPTQIYSIFFALSLFLFISFLKQKKRFDGFLFLNMAIMYSIFRFFIEFIRTTPKIFLSLTLSQWISILLFIFALIFIFIRRIENEKRD